MNNHRVLISGASIAGPALAFWLARYGFEVTIVERACALRPGGHAVDFRGTGTRVLERMGLLGEVRGHETRAGAITMVDAHNRVLARLPDGFTSGEVEVLRGDLARILYDATREDARYIFGDSIQSLTETPSGVEVSFASGRTDNFGLVAAADGLHSGTRAIAFGDESQFVHSMGYYFGIYTVPDILQLGDAGRYYVELGRRVACFGSNNHGNAKASFYFASRQLNLDRRDHSAQKALLRETFAGMPWHTQELLALMDQAPDFYFDSLSQVRMPCWSRGRVVLLGDAASCASPMAGMGTSIAMVGAYVLAGELSKANGDYATAFANYESTLRPFVTAAQKMAESVSWFIPTTRPKLWFSRKLWSWTPQSMLHKLMIEQPTQVASLVPLQDYA